jgi:hypothetical protein
MSTNNDAIKYPTDTLTVPSDYGTPVCIECRNPLARVGLCVLACRSCRVILDAEDAEYWRMRDGGGL